MGAIPPRDLADSLRNTIEGAVDSARSEVVDAATAVGRTVERGAAAVRGAAGRAVADARGALRDAADRLASVRDDVVRTVTLGRVDPEMERVSADVTRLRERLYADGQLTPAELDDLRRAIGAAAAKLATLAGRGREGPRGEYARARELREIHFEYLEGRDGAPGAISRLMTASPAERAARARDVALDVAGSADVQTARDKVNLLRASLSRVPDSRLQEDTLAAVEAALKTVPAGAIDAEMFHELAHLHATVAVHKSALPAEVSGTDAAFPNRPIPGWEATVRRSVAAGFDDLSARGELFIDKARPPAGRPLEVAVKLDLNLGMQGPPTVSDPAHTFATVVELGERAKKRGLPTHFNVGDSGGAENMAMGVKSLDIAKRTGNYHMALKAGLTLAAADGDAAAAAQLARLKAAEAAGYYAAGPGDPQPDGWAAAEKAAAKYVTVVDYDAAGWKDIPNDLGPLGRSLFAWDHFSVAKPWAEADARVHVTRSPSDHALLEKGKHHSMTGATKGLIGLHAIDRRPFWYGTQISGIDFTMAPFALTKGSSFAEVVGVRLGRTFPELLAGALPDEVKAQAGAAEGAWKRLRESGPAFNEFKVRLGQVEDEVKAARAAGATDRQAIEKARAGIRAALADVDAHNPGMRPPFSAQFRSASFEMTRLGEVLVGYERYLNPLPPTPGREFRGEDNARRIGLLTALQPGSDLVVTPDVKRGIAGGPDAYRHVLDVGETYVGTGEAAVDAAAAARTAQLLADARGRGGMLQWAADHNSTNPWDGNVLNGALQFGRAPMGPQEMTIVGDKAALDARFAEWNR